MPAPDAVVVGSGPNGLTAAVVLARAGLSVAVVEGAPTIGGGTRTEELTVSGLRHDVCSAVHPLGVVSPAFAALDLTSHGLAWAHPPLALAHALDGGRAATMHRSIETTAAGLGPDDGRWRRLFGPLAEAMPDLAPDLLGPLTRRPRHPVALARFAAQAGLPATLVGRAFAGEDARALFAGTAAHLMHPLDALGSSSVGMLLTAAGHHGGWPVAVGGSSAVTDALARALVAAGGTIETGRPVRSLAELGRPALTMLDVRPAAVVGLAGDALPDRVAHAYRRYRHGPGAWKVDLAVEGGVPWLAEVCRRAGTVHLGGTMAEIAHAERQVDRGRMPEAPFVLVAQQHLADPSRSVGDVHPVWAYAHVPAGYDGDGTAAVLAQLERFAPGVCERIVGMHVTSPATLAAANPNYPQGDIANGANDALQLLARPRPSLHPYATGIPGVFLCSAATPPGAGVHGMCGWHAARAALASIGMHPG